MPGPQRHMLNRDRICRKGKKILYDSIEEDSKMRKVRVICSDPDATDSSSDDDDEVATKKRVSRRIVKEIKFPVSSFATSLDSESSSLDIFVSRKEYFPEVATRTRILVDNFYCFEKAEKYSEVSSKKLKVEVAQASDESSDGSHSVSWNCSECDETLSVVSPSSVLDLSTSRSNRCANISIPDLEFCHETMASLPMASLPMAYELSSFFLDDFGQIFDDFGGLDNVPLCNFKYDENELVGLNLELDEEALAWMEL